METNGLLESYLKQLRLPTFLQNYAKFTEEAVRNNLDFPRYLLALAEQEVIQREQNQRQRRIKAARFPTLKELADFDFSALPQLNKALVLDLAGGEYILKREPILFIGNPGVGKTHLATALALEACRQGHKVRFWTAAGLVNELLLAQDEHRLHKLIASARKLHLVVLDEFGFIPFSPTGAQILFTFCSELYEHVALILTTNLKFADWTQILGESSTTECPTNRTINLSHNH